MSAGAQAIPAEQPTVNSFLDFLKDELAPYRGRMDRVLRMVLASTIVMIVTMTFRLPYGAFGSIFALILSRESVETTAKEAIQIVIGFAAAGAYIILGLTIASGDPTLRFVWIGTGVFIGFWAMSALRSYSASARFGYLIAITITLWDQHVTSEAKVRSTLWAIGVIILASLVTLAIEKLFYEFRKTGYVSDALAERLSCVEEFLVRDLAAGEANPATRTALARLAMTGTSRIRQTLRRSGAGAEYLARMGAATALVGRVVDLAAGLPDVVTIIDERERGRIIELTRRIAEIRASLERNTAPDAAQAGLVEGGCCTPLLRELEEAVQLIPLAFAGAEHLNIFMPSAEEKRQAQTVFPKSPLAPEHIQFGLRGCLAAMSCYIIFNALFWPEISTSVTTCFLTALTTTGASRQKQILRITGAIAGGFILGMGLQAFVLPQIDSIAGFTVLYAAAIAMASWLSTASPRFSYFGVQVAVAFCLINLQEFHFQTSLKVARDRVIGVLLGQLMMWLFFDQLWSRPAGTEMRCAFVTGLRLLARMTRGPLHAETKEAIEESYEIRDSINHNADQVRALADAVLFEFGRSREADLAFRTSIKRWQPELRTLSLIRVAALKYRLQTPGFQLPASVLAALQAYDRASALLLDGLADEIEKGIRFEMQDEPAHLLGALEDAACTGLPEAQSRSLIALMRQIDSLTRRLAADMTR